MTQVKKQAVRDAILKSASRLFARRGYEDTTLVQIAAGAGVSSANVYVYFSSKLDVLYAIYDPWLRRRLEQLERKLGRIADPRKRLTLLLTTLWRDLPAERNGFANNVMQAISTATREEGYDPALLAWVENKIAAMIRDALPAGGRAAAASQGPGAPSRRSATSSRQLAHVLMMAFDGFVINYHLRPQAACTEETIALMCDLLLGEPAAVRSRPARSSQVL
jgi:AcrR family transcriptional regulator